MVTWSATQSRGALQVTAGHHIATGSITRSLGALHGHLGAPHGHVGAPHCQVGAPHGHVGASHGHPVRGTRSPWEAPHSFGNVAGSTRSVTGSQGHRVT